MADRIWQPWMTVTVNGRPQHIARLTSTGKRKSRRAWRTAWGQSYRKARNG